MKNQLDQLIFHTAICVEAPQIAFSHTQFACAKIVYAASALKRFGMEDSMNVAFFLSPKNEIVYLYEDMTLRQAMQKMEHHRYQSLPILTSDGKYAGVVTEGDLLWAFKNRPGFAFVDAENMMLSDIPRHFHYETIAIDQSMDSLIDASYRQSFVPVVDDTDTFIGLIKRSDIIRYFYTKLRKTQEAGA